MKLYKYTEEQLRDAVVSSTSMRQVLMQLGVAPYGGNYDVLKKAIKHFNLDTSHFRGQAWNRGISTGSKQPIKKYLSNELEIQSYKLKKRLLKEGIFEHKCLNCLNTTWLGKPIPLELDHINGDNKDNRLKTFVYYVQIVMPSLLHTEARTALRLSSGLPPPLTC